MVHYSYLYSDECWETQNKIIDNYYDQIIAGEFFMRLAINMAIAGAVGRTYAHYFMFKQMTKSVSVINKALLQQPRHKHAVLSRLSTNRGGAFSQVKVDPDNEISILERSNAKRAKHTAFHLHRINLTAPSELHKVKLIGGKKVLERDGSFVSPWTSLDKHISQERVRSTAKPISGIFSTVIQQIKGKVNGM